MKFVAVDKVVDNMVVGYNVIEEATGRIQVAGIDRYCKALALAEAMNESGDRKIKLFF